MSYRAPIRRPGLGQAKWVPGQLSFQALPPGVTAPPDFQRLREAGLPIAPYIEHGSWETGEPDVMRYGFDPYRGIMGLGMLPPGNIPGLRRRLRRAHAGPRGLGESGDGLGCFLATLFRGAAGPTPQEAAAAAVAAARPDLVPSRLMPGAPGHPPVPPRTAPVTTGSPADLGTGTVTCNGQVVLSNADYSTAMGIAAVTARRNQSPCTVRVTGGVIGSRTITVGPSGPAAVSGLSGWADGIPVMGALVGAAIGAGVAHAAQQNPVAGGVIGAVIGSLTRQT